METPHTPTQGREQINTTKKRLEKEKKKMDHPENTSSSSSSDQRLIPHFSGRKSPGSASLSLTHTLSDDCKLVCI